MQYWRLKVVPTKDCGYDVFYKTPIALSQPNVARNAVADGDLVDTFLPFVGVVEQISKEQYYENMDD